MRERKRSDYDPINWRYRAEIIGPLPEIIMQTGRKMNRLWNELVAIHNRTPYRLLRSVEGTFRDLARSARMDAGCARERGDEETAAALDLKAEAYAARAKEIKATAQTVAKQSYRGFDEEKRQWTAPLVAQTIADRRACDEPLLDIPLDYRINHHTQERGNELNLPVWCKWYVGDTFKNALKAYAKKIRFAPRRKDDGDPPSIHIEQRTTSGEGWPIDQLFARRKPFSVKPSEEDRYEGWEAFGWISIHNESIPLKLIMHRPFPAGAIVKRYSLVGRYEPSAHKWMWWVVFQLETPPRRLLYAMTHRMIAIDLGYRVFEDESGDSIRLMMIYDGHQYIDVRLPYDLTSRRKRAHLSRCPRIDIREAWKIQSCRDKMLEECKAALRTIDTSNWPASARAKLRGGAKMRREGLLAIRNILAKEGLTCAPIESWLEADGPLWQRQRYIEVSWHASRNEILRTLAVWLSEQCDCARWEGDLSLRKMAQEERRRTEARIEEYARSGQWEARTNEERRLAAAQRNRRLANLSQFRVWFREAMEKRGREIIDEEAAYSSRICHKCKGEVEASADLIVRCKRCQTPFDQDKNTARYFWNNYDADTRAVARPLAPVNRSILEKVWRVVSASPTPPKRQSAL